MALGLVVIPVSAAGADATATTAKDPLQSSQWRYMKRRFFKDAPVVFDARVRVRAPAHAQDPQATPVQVRAPGLHNVRQVRVFADGNPAPAILDYWPVRAEPSIAFSFKVQAATPIRAAMRTADGVWHVGGRWLDARGGGCSVPDLGPPRDDDSAAQTGRIDARQWPNGHGARLKLRIAHPMAAGRIAGSRAFFIERIVIANADGRVLARVATQAMLARNPVLTLHLRDRGALTVAARDNRGQRYTADVAAPGA